MNITMTGVDERTKVIDMISLSNAGVEIGILYTHSPDGRNRYPSRQRIDNITYAVKRCAVHICGRRARHELLECELDAMLQPVRRIQVNGIVSARELQWVCQRYEDKQIITQHRRDNLHLLETNWPNHALLVDASGGRGKLPGVWDRPATIKPVGFAGGLGPDTLSAELPKIEAVAQGDWWIDMEGRLRDEQDWFSIDRAAQATRIWTDARKRLES